MTSTLGDLDLDLEDDLRRLEDFANERDCSRKHSVKADWDVTMRCCGHNFALCDGHLREMQKYVEDFMRNKSLMTIAQIQCLHCNASRNYWRKRRDVFRSFCRVEKIR